MSDRERWFIYPLLFFTLCMVVRGQFVASDGVSEFDQVACNSLTVNSADGRPLIRLQENYNMLGEVVLLDEDLSAVLTAADAGGMLMLVRSDDGEVLMLGHDGGRRISGFHAIDAHTRQMRPLMVHDPRDPLALRLMPWSKPKPAPKPKDSDRKPPPEGDDDDEADDDDGDKQPRPPEPVDDGQQTGATSTSTQARGASDDGPS